MYILGINAVFHDSSACLLKDGRLLAAAEEERFTHYKHGKRPIPFSTYELPYHAIDYCLRAGGITLKEVDEIAYSFDPYELLPTSLNRSPEIDIPLFHNNKYEGDWTSPWDPLFLSSIINAPGQLSDGWPYHLQPRFIGAKGEAFCKPSPRACGQRISPITFSGCRRHDHRWTRRENYHGLLCGIEQ
jgi:carbamoyltransferase